jgi:adhesin/invasin
VSTTYTASTTAGSCTITATEAISGSPGTAVITQTAVPNNIAAAANPAAIRADGTSTSTVTATVTMGVGGAAVSGDTVNFTATGAAGVCTNASLSALTGMTNASGQVSVTYTASTTIGFCTVKATETATGSSASATIDQTQ